MLNAINRFGWLSSVTWVIYSVMHAVGLWVSFHRWFHKPTAVQIEKGLRAGRLTVGVPCNPPLNEIIWKLKLDFRKLPFNCCLPPSGTKWYWNQHPHKPSAGPHIPPAFSCDKGILSYTSAVNEHRTLYMTQLAQSALACQDERTTKASPTSITHLTLNNYNDQTPYLGGTWSHKISFRW